jgi:hypothetical protein
MRGKLRFGIMPRRKNWRDVLKTVLATDIPRDEIMLMTPPERQKAQQEAHQAALEQFQKRHREREAVWLAWARSTAPLRAPTWKGRCEQLGRMDLHQPHSIDRLDGVRETEVSYD